MQVSASTNTVQAKSNKEETAQVQYLATDLRLLAWRGHISSSTCSAVDAAYFANGNSHVDEQHPHAR
jgi:hypothetical protein